MTCESLTLTPPLASDELKSGTCEPPPGTTLSRAVLAGASVKAQLRHSKREPAKTPALKRAPGPKVESVAVSSASSSCAPNWALPSSRQLFMMRDGTLTSVASRPEKPPVSRRFSRRTSCAPRTQTAASVCSASAAASTPSVAGSAPRGVTRSRVTTTFSRHVRPCGNAG
jgi:hypothetical protein